MKPTISPTEHAALFTIINKSRLLNGWTTRTAKELDPTIRVWHSSFARYDIPLSAYEELYQRAFDVRQSKMQLGDLNKVPALDATLIVSLWTGPNGLRAEMQMKQAANECRECGGTGFVIRNHPGGNTSALKCEYCRAGMRKAEALTA